MPLLMIAKAVILNPEKFANYVEGAGKLMLDHGVEVVMRGRYDHTLKGATQGEHIMAAFRYDSRDTLEAFFGSPAYAELIPLRDEACEMEFQVYEEL
ncbi:isoleucyl-tRNA synthetase [Roseobacter sp. SK209-2-6]|uniref:DUF1330 domain-containing protein n=1 Tax=Roseobacter sp. SK209-2-6 TaxID=388739 RepID=UPI0000F3CE8A|nr:DUF1330 domain-containing protein [Roseobacter sp. SK209-2-6]EBA15941.1 isoleucyl-tRNA synthetase [Roseobacter sp. SK209-2-6]